jgi:hypothetical protein
VPANAAVPQFDTQPSREGTTAHWCGETVLRSFASQVSDGVQPLLCSELIGETAPNGVVIDDKMAEGAQIWVDDVLAVCQEYGALRSMLIEHRVHMPQIHADNWGTLDTAVPVPDHGLLYVWDYKNGHREHSPVDHLQLIDYVFGLANEMRLPEDTTVVLRIVQPFSYSSAGPVKEWRVQLSELYNRFFEHLRRMALEALTNPKFTAGTHCRDCAAVGRCPTARRAGYSVIAYLNEPYQIDTMTGADLAVERKLLGVGETIIKARSKAIHDELTYRINDGATDTGLALQSKFGNLDWSVPAAQAIALAGQFDADIAKPGVLTPTQAKARVTAAMRPAFESVLKTVTARNSTGMKLIDAADCLSAQAFKKSK